MKAKALNANLVTFVFIINFVVIGGIIVANTPVFSSRVNEVALAVSSPTPLPTATPMPTNTPLPPTATPSPQPTSTPRPPTATPLPSSTPAPTTVPTEASTPQTAADASSNNAAADTNAAYDPALVARGQELFLLCSACHGPDGRGLPNLGKDLVNSEFVRTQTDDQLVQFITTGRPIWDPLNTTGLDMPPKGGNPAMTTEDIHAVVAYIRSLAAQSGQ